tara:strand:+ start:1445 stop:2563 length:1119 start_codon:yes stop_codon:yes gene_type:complete
MKQVVILIVFALLLPIATATESNDFSDSANLEPGVMVSGYVTESDGDNPVDRYKIQVSPRDTVQILFTSNEADFCVYMGPNGSQELDCFYEGELGDAGNVELFKKESTEFYYFRIDCGSTALDCSPSTEYTLKVIIYIDEAGDSINEAAELLPETRVNGWAALDEFAEPIDFDYYRTPVIENDIIQVEISSNDMTSYRMYDQNGIKIGEGYEEGNYDFSVNLDYSGDLFIEIFCTQNYGEPCDYSLFAIGSTYVNSSIDSRGSEDESSKKILTNSPYALIGLMAGLFVILVLFFRNRNGAIPPVQPSIETRPDDDEIHRLKQTVIQAELEKAEIQKELEKTKSSSVVHNITYNIQDSAISGDINTSLKKQGE